MCKLLRANFVRMGRDKVFWIGMAVLFLMGAALPILHFVDNRTNGTGWTADASFFTYAFVVPVLLSVLTALFVGSEYSDGTLRNQRMVGHKRSSIYLANLIVCVAAAAALCVAYLIPHTCLGLALLGKLETAPQTLLLYVGLNFALMVAFTALFTLIAMLCQNKAYTVAGCILLVFALLFAGVRITSALNEPEYFQPYSYTENGVTVSEPAERNPNYLSGTKRQVYGFLRNFTPGGQAILLANMATERPELLALYDGILLTLSTGCGLVVFRRKDLK